VLDEAVAKASDIEDFAKQAEDYKDSVIPAMQAVRQSADELEKIVDADLWPLPSYAEMLFLK
jgi:glutamine synthetase